MKSIFVSSTFRDFQYERDALRKKVLPRLNAIANNVGEVFMFCDLRWGVNTLSSEDRNAKVIDICLSEIDRSRPNIIVLIGERYGFCPGKDSIEKESLKRDLYLEDFDISVTALEIEYGVFYKMNSNIKAHIYYRNLIGEDIPSFYRDASKEQIEKLENLKMRLKNLNGVKYVEYDAIYDSKTQKIATDDFADLVFEDLKTAFADELYGNVDEDSFDKELAAQWNYIHEKATHFKLFDDFANSLKAKLESGETVINAIALRGNSGEGKSTMFSHICCEMERQGWSVCPIVCGTTTRASTVNGTIRTILSFIAKALNENQIVEDIIKQEQQNNDNAFGVTDDIEAIDVLNKLIAVANKSKKKIFIAIDGLEVLSNGNLAALFDFLPIITRSEVRILLTCRENVKLPKIIPFLDMPVLVESDCKQMIDHISNKKGKEMYDSVAQYIIQNAAVLNPLMLYMKIEYLTLLDVDNFASGSKDENAIVDMLLENLRQTPDDLNAMAYSLINKIQIFLSSDIIIDALTFIACSRNGLRIEDITELMLLMGKETPISDFYMFVYFIPEIMMLRYDGRFDFLHDCFRQGLIKNCENIDFYKNVLSNYFIKSYENNPIALDDALYFAIRNDDKKSALDILNHSKDVNEQLKLSQIVYEYSLVDSGIWQLELIEYAIRANHEIVNSKKWSKLWLLVCHYYSNNDMENRIKCDLEFRLMLQRSNDVGEELLDSFLAIGSIYSIISVGKDISDFSKTDKYRIVYDNYLSKFIKVKTPPYINEILTMCSVLLLKCFGDIVKNQERNIDFALEIYEVGICWCNEYEKYSKDGMLSFVISNKYDYYRAIGDIYWLDKHDETKALEYYEPANNFYATHSDEDLYGNHGVILDRLCDYYHKRYQNDSKQTHYLKAVHYARLSANAWTKYSERRPSIDAIINRCLSYCKFSDLSVNDGTNANLKEALKYATLACNTMLDFLSALSDNERLPYAIVIKSTALITDILVAQNKKTEAVDKYKTIIDRFATDMPSMTEAQKRFLATLYNNQGILYEKLGDYPEALNSMKNAEASLKGVSPSIEKDKLMCCIKAFSVESKLKTEGNLDVSDIEKIIELSEKYYDRDDWGICRALQIGYRIYGEIKYFANGSVERAHRCYDYYTSKKHLFAKEISLCGYENTFYPIAFWICYSCGFLLSEDKDLIAEQKSKTADEFFEYLKIIVHSELTIDSWVQLAAAIQIRNDLYIDSDHESELKVLRESIAVHEECNKNTIDMYVKRINDFALMRYNLLLSLGLVGDDYKGALKCFDEAFFYLEKASLFKKFDKALLSAFIGICDELLEHFNNEGNKKIIKKLKSVREKLDLRLKT